ncbi:hypothetical protein BayCH28_27475 [Mycolicibacterium sp. CH28]|uniref:hypothetical protein n=1 Tax=Mycolicibacterium sp. CH28 TaxID=2512237 RepID=UPI001081D45D|nr:hypothetical protein [Mycolicibacterium sp. CH28]TGD84006.1 hypothetical protein BayCH28_27475 [Mycolicibacterium sp. CH28]
MTATAAHTPTRAEAQELLAILDRVRAKLVVQRGELARQLRELASRIDGVDRQIEDVTVSAEWLTAVARHPSSSRQV